MDSNLFGFEVLRRGLALAIGYALQQKLNTRRLAVEELFNDVTIGMP